MMLFYHEPPPATRPVQLRCYTHVAAGAAPRPKSLFPDKTFAADRR